MVNEAIQRALIALTEKERETLVCVCWGGVNRETEAYALSTVPQRLFSENWTERRREVCVCVCVCVCV